MGPRKRTRKPRKKGEAPTSVPHKEAYTTKAAAETPATEELPNTEEPVSAPHDVEDEATTTATPKDLDDEAVASEHSETGSLHSTSEASTTADTEPAFHMDVLGASIQDILQKDTLSAMAVSSKSIAMGMHSGMIYIVSRSGHLEKGFRFHSATVLDLVFDTTGDFIGSAGMDGIVAIASLTSSEQYQFDFQRPMRTIALEPQFGHRSSRAFVCGGMSGILVHREKRWFGHREVVLHSEEGPIWAITWRGSWIAWANDRGVRIADAISHDVITFIPAPDVALRAELVRCTLTWRDDHTLLIAQGDRITIASVKTRDAPEDQVRAAIPSVPTLSGLVSGLSSSADVPLKHFVEITDIFQLDCIVAGVAWMSDNIVTLSYVVDSDVLASLGQDDVRLLSGQPPELRVISRSGDEQSSDVLDLANVDRCRCNDYHLCVSYEWVYDNVLKEKVQKPVYFLASPRQVCRLRPRTEQDHIQWLLEHAEYREALEALEALGSGPAKAMGFDVAAIGREYLLYMMDEHHDYEGAAELFPLILRKDASAWESFVLLYLERGKVSVVLPFIPTRDPELGEMVYDMVLVALLRTDEAALLATLRTWPGHLYSAQAVAAAIEDRAENSRVLLECLAQLYLTDHQPSKALLYLLRLRHPSVFGLIRDNNLLIDVQQKIGLLVELDQDLAETKQPEESVLISLLVDHTHAIPIHRAMQQLEPYPWYQYLYLDALFERDASMITDYANRLVYLYAEYQYPKLMPFLRAMSSVYSFQRAYVACEAHNYVPEMVFLRGRTGDLRGALDLILDRLDDVEMAIDFVRQQDDIELWGALLAHAQNKPNYIRGLLEHAGGEINPVRIIRPIEKGLVIPGLRPALIKTMQNFQLQNSLLHGGLVVLERDAQELGHQYTQALTAAMACDAATECTVCGRALLQKPFQRIVLFFCWHAAHASCLPAASLSQSASPRSVARQGALVRISETTTQLDARAREPWIGGDPHMPPQPRQDGDEGVTRTWKQLRSEQADRQSLTRARQRRAAGGGHNTGCPTCAADMSYRLQD